MLVPNVSRYMTRAPYAVAPTDSLIHAKALMDRYGIRHLPVLDGDTVVGVVSDQDLAVVEATPGVDLARVEMTHVMKEAVCVWREEPIEDVAALMAEKKCDCVVVRGGRGVAGIFTATDALQALAEIVRRACA